MTRNVYYLLTQIGQAAIDLGRKQPNFSHALTDSYPKCGDVTWSVCCIVGGHLLDYLCHYVITAGEPVT